MWLWFLHLHLILQNLGLLFFRISPLNILNLSYFGILSKRHKVLLECNLQDEYYCNVFLCRQDDLGSVENDTSSTTWMGSLSLSLYIYIYHLFPKKHSIQQSFESLNVGFTMVHDNCHTVLPDYIFHIKSLSSVLHDGVSIISCRHGGVPGENLRTTWLSGPCAFAQLGMQWCEPWILGKRFGAGHDGV